MINLFQGGGIYSYGDSTNIGSTSRPGFRTPLPVKRGIPIPMPATTTHLGPDCRPGEYRAGTQGKDDFWMKMYDGFAEDSWKVLPSLL